MWIIRDGRTQTATGAFESEPEKAEAALAAYIARKYEPPKGLRDPMVTLITDALIFYSETKAPSLADPGRIATAFENLERFWGKEKISEIRGETCRAYVDQRLEQGKAVGTARRELEALQAAVRLYHAEGYLTSAPRVTLPKKPAPKDRWLTRTESARLLTSAKQIRRARGHLPLFIMIGLMTGTRRDAILALQWLPNNEGGWIDLENRMLYRRPLGAVETSKRKPPSPLPRKLMPFLYAARKRTRKHVLEYKGNRIGSIKKSFATACINADLEDVTPHVLRHTCGTWLALDGVPIYKAARYMGVSPLEFERTYAHYHPDYLGEVTDSIDRTF
jgi:integrase